MSKTTIWVSKELRNELHVLKMNSDKKTLEEILLDMIAIYKQKFQEQN
jgi:hypothetical protein